MAKALVLAGKIVGATILFVLSLLPVHWVLLEWVRALEGSLYWFDPPFFVLALVVLPMVWWASWLWARNRLARRRQVLQALWVLVPVFLGSLVSLPIYYFYVLLDRMGH